MNEENPHPNNLFDTHYCGAVGDALKYEGGIRPG